MYQLTREQMETQARAKILWGESQEAVVTFLISYGMDAQEAWGVVQELQAERAATIRVSGIKKIIIGVVCVLVPIGSFVAFKKAGVLPVKLFAVTVVIGLFGGWKFVSGIFNIIFPESEQGDLADDSEA